MKKLQLMVIEMRKDIGLIWVFILFVAIAMCGCTDVPTGNRYDGMSLQEIQSVAINPGYDSVFRGIEQYQGKVIHITGQVIQAQSDSGGIFFEWQPFQHYLDSIPMVFTG